LTVPRHSATADPHPIPAAPTAPEAEGRGPRSTGVLALLAILAAAAFAGFFALGTWQVERRAWKLDLIAKVDERIRAPAVAPPGPDAWPRIDAGEAYRRLRLTGAFQHDRETLVQAATALGSGFWVLTPMRLADGTTVLVNRGFVPPEARDPAARAATAPRGETTVTGLLRLAEPGGAFLRRNDPAAGRWYSRDVAAIAAAQGLERAAPYFVDADADPGGSPAGAAGNAGAAAPAPAGAERAWPVGGLTVVSFHNNHLVYALTWYALAAMVAAAAFHVGRDERRVRRRHARRPAAGAGHG
jgi:surfeit locus 1 family protein